MFWGSYNVNITTIKLKHFQGMQSLRYVLFPYPNSSNFKVLFWTILSIWSLLYHAFTFDSIWQVFILLEISSRFCWVERTRLFWYSRQNIRSHSIEMMFPRKVKLSELMMSLLTTLKERSYLYRLSLRLFVLDVLFFWVDFSGFQDLNVLMLKGTTFALSKFFKWSSLFHRIALY